MQKRETCVDCGVYSPGTSTDHTLTSSLGWRLMRRQYLDGSWHAEWRCGVCWNQHKAKAKDSAEATRVCESRVASHRAAGAPDAASLKPSSSADAREKPPTVVIAPNGATPMSLAAPSRALLRRSR